MDPDRDPPIFVRDQELLEVSIFLVFQSFFFAYYFLKEHLHHFSKIKSYKEITKQ